jgi:hypothetical protein
LHEIGIVECYDDAVTLARDFDVGVCAMIGNDYYRPERGVQTDGSMLHMASDNAAGDPDGATGLF